MFLGAAAIITVSFFLLGTAGAFPFKNEQDLRDLIMYGKNDTAYVERTLQGNGSGRRKLRGRGRKNSYRRYPGLDFPYRAPTEGQHRSPCPAINTLANHGLIDRSGIDIPVEQLAVQIGLLMDIDPEIPRVNGIAGARRSGMLRLNDDGEEILTISDLFCHNAEEHDSSFVRPDNGLVGTDAAKEVSPELAFGLLSLSPQRDFLNRDDIETYQRIRMTNSRDTNPTVDFNPSGKFNVAGESTYAFLIGQTRDLSRVSKLAMLTFLVFERVPQGYIPFNVRNPARYNPVTNPDTASWLYDFSAGTPEGEVFGYYTGVFEDIWDRPLGPRQDNCTDVP